MAQAIPSHNNNTLVVADNESDYGSDFDEAAIDTLHSQNESQIATSAALEPPILLDDHGDTKPFARLGKIRANLQAAVVGLNEVSATLRPQTLQREDSRESVEVEYDERNRQSFSRSYYENDRICRR
jgi:exonuclease V